MVLGTPCRGAHTGTPQSKNHVTQNLSASLEESKGVPRIHLVRARRGCSSIASRDEKPPSEALALTFHVATIACTVLTDSVDGCVDLLFS